MADASRSCLGCRHAAREDDGSTLSVGRGCLHIASREETLPGVVRHHTTDEMRGDSDRCGLEGAWFFPLFANPDAQAVWLAQQGKADA